MVKVRKNKIVHEIRPGNPLYRGDPMATVAMIRKIEDGLNLKFHREKILWIYEDIYKALSISFPDGKEDRLIWARDIDRFFWVERTDMINIFVDNLAELKQGKEGIVRVWIDDSEALTLTDLIAIVEAEKR